MRHVFGAVHDVHRALFFQHPMTLLNTREQPAQEDVFVPGLDHPVKILSDIVRRVGKD
ncbi:hypothetical protein SDC9_189584 [bioreactor metagenome]|uniref:Uncharacterized protein n=1 Tax=bioreactor metagenome TaxID=1076179 RepID=A0A645HSK3_9ZZZZ